ncbi:aspartate aminotransferase [Candidatus Parcubacteria bacterium]|nr:MAG: aspartate aminotransferase [Candidatus Parcubacteria bacterium]
MLSKRIKNIKESGIRKIFNKAQGLNAKDIVNLSIGQPHFQTPLGLKNAAIKAINSDHNAYTPTSGIEELRELISEKLRLKNNIPADKSEIIVTSGASGSLYLAFSAIFDKGDEIIIPEPYFVSYKQIADFHGLKTTYLKTGENFRISPKDLERCITKKTKALILNSPNNPTGVTYSSKEIIAITKIAKKHNIFIISDEIYEIFDYDKKFCSVASYYDKTITINGFSKSHSITGWRVGYVHAPKEIIEAMSNLQQYTFVCSPAPMQKALLDGFNISLEKQVAYYKENRDYLWTELKGCLQFPKPEGAFYAFIKSPKPDFINSLITKGLLVVPGEVFSSDNEHFRISFAVDRNTLKKGIKIIKDSL